MFVPNTENKPTVNHIDGNKQNNAVENLEWATHQENTLHAYQNGLAKSRIKEFTKRLQDNPQTKLTNDQVREIREKRKQGYTYNALSLEYPVSLSAVHRICTNQTWKTLE